VTEWTTLGQHTQRQAKRSDSDPSAPAHRLAASDATQPPSAAMSATPQPSPQQLQPAPTPPPRPAAPAEVAMSAIKTRPAVSNGSANGSAAAGPPPPPRPLVVNSPLPLPVKGAPIASDADQAALWAEVGLEVNEVHKRAERDW